MTLWPTWFESSVCQTPMTPVITGIATIPATRAVSSLDVLLRDCDVEHLAQEERRDDADRGGEHDERTHRGKPCSIRTNSGKILRRLALRTAGSAGRTGGSSGIEESNRRPGTSER